MSTVRNKTFTSWPAFTSTRTDFLIIAERNKFIYLFIFLIFLQTTLAVPAVQIKECRVFFFRTSVLTSFFWKPEAPSIFLSSHRAQLTTTRTNLGVLFFSILLLQNLVSRMTLFLHADVLFPQMSIILSHKPRPPLTEMSNTWPCLWQPGRRAQLLLAGGTSGTPTGPKTLRTRCRWSVGEETSRSIQVKVMYFVVVVIFFYFY